MANTAQIAGIDTHIGYTKETTYGTAVGTASLLTWSYIQGFNPSIKNNMIATRGFVGTTSDARAVQKFSPGQLDISWSMDLIPNNFAFMEYMLGSATTTASTSTFETVDSPPSFTMVHNMYNVGTARQETYSGCVLNSMSLKAAVGEPLSVNLAGMSSLVKYDATEEPAVAVSTEDVWTFQHGSLGIGTTNANIIDSVELNVTNNYEMKYGLGTRLAKTVVPKARDISLRFTVKYLDDKLYSKLLGAATPTATGSPTAVVSALLTFTNGARSLTVTCSNGYIEEFSGTNNLNELIGEDFTLNAKGVGIVWDNKA